MVVSFPPFKGENIEKGKRKLTNKRTSVIRQPRGKGGKKKKNKKKSKK